MSKPQRPEVQHRVAARRESAAYGSVCCFVKGVARVPRVGGVFGCKPINLRDFGAHDGSSGSAVYKVWGRSSPDSCRR